VELKVWRDGRPDPLPDGRAQLSASLDRLGLADGTLVLFDGRSQAPPLPGRCLRTATGHGDHRFDALRL
jgi:hypothetical protein